MNRWMASKVQVAREFVLANATFMILVGDILNLFTSTLENQRDMDPTECDLVQYFQKKVKLCRRFKKNSL